MNIFDNDIIINLVIGFFYSSIIGLFIYVLTEKYRQLNEIENHLIDIEKFELSTRILFSELLVLKNINYENYLNLVFDFLSNKPIDMNNYDDVDELILFKEFPKLPDISSYLANKSMTEVDDEIMKIFVELGIDYSVEGLHGFIQDYPSFKELHSEINRKLKDKDLVERFNSCVISLMYYSHLNISVNELNNLLEYYREYLRVILSINGEEEIKNKDLLERQFRTFQYLVNKIKPISERILKELDNIHSVSKQAKAELKEKKKKIRKDINLLIRFLIILMVLSLVFIIIA